MEKTEKECEQHLLELLDWLVAELCKCYLDNFSEILAILKLSPVMHARVFLWVCMLAYTISFRTELLFYVFPCYSSFVAK
jgi:hypothetical protein